MRRLVVVLAALVLVGGLIGGYQWWEQRQFRENCESIRQDLRASEDVLTAVDEVGVEAIKECWPER
jgi:hypothetical protein